MFDLKKAVFSILGGFLAGALIFGLVGYYGRNVEFAKTKFDPDYSWEMAQVDPMQIRDYLVELSSDPHMAGQERDEILAEFVAEQWRTAGLDHVKVEGYKMLLDYPDKNNPNLITIMDNSGQVIFTSHFKEEGVDHPNFVDAFNAYSKPGVVEGIPVYVNFGGVEDFELIKELNVDVTGKICLAMYGNGFRGNKAENAYQAGCSGLIIFSDPKDVAQNGTDPSQVYPNTFWLPGTGIQRGSLSLVSGDPLTPSWPSLENVYNLDSEERKEYLPKIPVQPIGYADAEQIFNKLGGEIAPNDWQGSIPGLKYRIGGEFSSAFQGSKIKLTVNNKMEERVSSNVIGFIYGDVEPDKYVLIGNHRDAWGFGALDPSSGTAPLMETVRVLGKKKKIQGWRPRRTMIFLNWGAEEYGLIGSREFMEQYINQLEQRGVAYINTDVCMSGPILTPIASPALANLLVRATKDIYSPENQTDSYFDFWKKWAGVPENEEFKPKVQTPGSGSDHANFAYYSGIPVVDIQFNSDPNEYKTNVYPTYHTGFETLYLVDNIYDPDYKLFRACCQLNLRLGLEIADSSLLPFDISVYSDVMEEAMMNLENQGMIMKLNGLGIETVHFKDSIYALRGAFVTWKEYIENLDINNDEMKMRYINDQITGFEKTLLLSEGLPGRIQTRHAFLAPSLFNNYGSSAFPGILDLLHGIDELPAEDKQERIKTLKRHVSDLMIVAKRAAEFLRPVHIL